MVSISNIGQYVLPFYIINLKAWRKFLEIASVRLLGQSARNVRVFPDTLGLPSSYGHSESVRYYKAVGVDLLPLRIIVSTLYAQFGDPFCLVLLQGIGEFRSIQSYASHGSLHNIHVI